MHNNPKISLIITAQDRIEELKRFIKSLLAQRYKEDIELIFVNQGLYTIESDFTFPENITYIPINIGHIMPLSRARNIGLKHATGYIVAFPDDDCWYEENLLQRIMEYFIQNSELDCICTNVYDPLIRKIYGGRPFGIRKRMRFVDLFKLPISVGIFVKLESLDRVCREFDESLGAGTYLGSGEETDLVSRLLSANMKIDYVGDIQVYHPVPEYMEMDCNKYYSYGLGFGYLNGKLMRSGHISLVWYLLEMAVRSAMGVVVNFKIPVKRKLYWMRLLGIGKGFICGLQGSLSGHP
ncbi:MAG: glycosyltransferase family 2 protein [Pelobacteraceae bacterium]